MSWNYRRFFSAGVGVAIWASLVGCADSGGGHPSVEAAFLDLQSKPVSAVVAEVDGRPISAEELSASQRVGDASGATLEQLLERELLVAEAVKRKYHTRPTLQHARKQAMVQQLLAQEVEGPVKVDTRDADALKKAEDALRQQVGHPPGLQASHILVSVPPDAQKDAAKEDVEKWFAQAKEWLAVLRDDLPDRPTIPDLYEVRARYRDELPKPLEIHVNAHLMFPIDAYLADEKGAADAPQYGRALPETWRPVVPEFGQAATDMARADNFGQLSDPVKSNFGWHLLMAEKLYPAALPDEQQLSEVARAQVERQARHKELVARMTEWMEDASVQTFPQVISEAHDTQN